VKGSCSESLPYLDRIQDDILLGQTIDTQSIFTKNEMSGFKTNAVAGQDSQFSPSMKENVEPTANRSSPDLSVLAQWIDNAWNDVPKKRKREDICN
jgi:hypothetical protein